MIVQIKKYYYWYIWEKKNINELINIINNYADTNNIIIDINNNITQEFILKISKINKNNLYPLIYGINNNNFDIVRIVLKNASKTI